MHVVSVMCVYVCAYMQLGCRNMYVEARAQVLLLFFIFKRTHFVRFLINVCVSPAHTFTRLNAFVHTYNPSTWEWGVETRSSLESLASRPGSVSELQSQGKMLSQKTGYREIEEIAKG